MTTKSGLAHRVWSRIRTTVQQAHASPPEILQLRTLSHTWHDSEGKLTVYTSMSLPLCNLHMRAIMANAVEELVHRRPKRPWAREARGETIKATGRKSARVVVMLALLHRGESRGSNPPATANRGHFNHINAAVGVTTSNRHQRAWSAHIPSQTRGHHCTPSLGEGTQPLLYKRTKGLLH